MSEQFQFVKFRFIIVLNGIDFPCVTNYLKAKISSNSECDLEKIILPKFKTKLKF